MSAALPLSRGSALEEYYFNNDKSSLMLSCMDLAEITSEIQHIQGMRDNLGSASEFPKPVWGIVLFSLP